MTVNVIHFARRRADVLLGGSTLLVAIVLLGSPIQIQLGYGDAIRYSPTRMPDRIVLTWQTDPSISQAVSWRSATGVGEAVVELAVAASDPEFVENSRLVPARTSVVRTESGMALYHSANLTGLSPSTAYAYRVGDGEHWSEWLQFTTASARPEPFTFIYFGDAQTELHSLWSRAIRAAYSAAPEARFMIHAGDLVNQRGRSHDAEWGEWFDAGDWIFGMVPNIPAAGNHDYVKNRRGDYTGLAAQWEVQFALPENGPPGLGSSVYFLDYQGVRIIVLDSNHAIHFDSAEAQAEWLEPLLRDNPNAWTIVAYHHPLTTTSEEREDPAALNRYWRPLFERYGVDLVLQGHDHTYSRDSDPVRQGEIGPIYLVSVSGPKMYDVTEIAREQLDLAGGAVQLFQLIEIDGPVLRFQARAVTGEVFDAFQLVRHEDGRKSLVESTSAVAPPVNR
jgi:3',5'-cyclic AMP phosphodiesterase CpdA